MSTSSTSSSNSGSSSSSSSSSSSGSSVGEDASISPSDVYLEALAELYLKRYLNSQEVINKDRALLRLILDDWKHNRPEIFRSYVQLNPETFDDLVATIQDDEVFHNKSNNEQMDIEEQVVIALYRFGHYGNAASNMKVALQFGVGYGTVRLATNRVLAAACSESFWKSALQWTSDEDKVVAKAWVEANSCPAWRDGWCMVDGTLIPLFQWPAFFGNVWFDRKSNYSLNLQV